MKGSPNLAGSQLISDTIVANQPTRLPLISVPIKGAKRTFVILSLALAGCRGPIAPLNPTTDVLSFKFLTDTTSAPLLRKLTNAYRPNRFIVTTDLKTASIDSVISLLTTTGSPYALLDYLPQKMDSKFWLTPIATDGVAIIVNPSNALPNLSAVQLRSVLQGRITNWQELGGLDMSLSLVVLDETNSSTMLIQSLVMGERRVSRSARLATTDANVVEIVANDPSAIGYVSMGYLTSSVRTVALEGDLPSIENVTAHRYPIYTPMVFVGLQEPGNDIYRAFFSWVQSPEGQAIVQQHYGGVGQP
jgi:hypothetical protein